MVYTVTFSTPAAGETYLFQIMLIHLFFEMLPSALSLKNETCAGKFKNHWVLMPFDAPF